MTTWDEVAGHFDVRRCSGCASGNHARGWARVGIVHWSDRKMTRIGLRRFLVLIASQRLVPIEEEWKRLWAYNTWAALAAAELHVRIPSRYSDNDRARARWLMARDNTGTPEARRWAARRSKS